MVSVTLATQRWMFDLLQYYDEDLEDLEGNWGIKLLDKEARKLMWITCMKLKADVDGVPAQACRLLEKYLAIKLKNLPEDETERQAIKESLLIKMPLLMASCAQLATKMVSFSVNVSPKIVRQVVLEPLGLSFNIQQVVCSEYEVFSSLGFKVPLWTSEQVVEIITNELGMSPRTIKAMKLIMNVTEYRRDRLDKLVRWASVTSCPAYRKCSIRTIHVIAGVISAGAMYLRHRPNGDKLDRRLALLTDIYVEYIKCIANAIITDILADI